MNRFLVVLLFVSLAAAGFCGDNIVDPGEECDGGDCCVPSDSGSSSGPKPCTIYSAADQIPCSVQTLCKAATTCDGVNVVCPAQPFTVDAFCAASNDSCVEKYTCDLNGDCKPLYRPSTYFCKEANLANCDTGATCPGDKPSCPTESKPAPKGTVCGLSLEECVKNQVCNGVSTGCPAALDEPTSKPCGDCPENPTKCDGKGKCPICTPGVVNDPIITGFHHQQFEFMGKYDHFYNFFSQNGLSINAKIHKAHKVVKKHRTVMGEIGLVTANNKVQFDSQTGKTGLVQINGKEVTLNNNNNLVNLEDCVQLTWSSRSIMISSSDFEIVFVFRTASKKEDINVDYINMKIVHVSGKPETFSGVVGQTAVNHRHVDHKASHFEVSNIFAHNFKTNTYKAEALTCTGKRDQAINFGAAASHQLEEASKYLNAAS